MSLSSLSSFLWLWREFVDVLCYYLWGAVEWIVDVDVPLWAFLVLEFALLFSLVLFAALKEF